MSLSEVKERTKQSHVYLHFSLPGSKTTSAKVLDVYVTHIHTRLPKSE